MAGPVAIVVSPLVFPAGGGKAAVVSGAGAGVGSGTGAGADAGVGVGSGAGAGGGVGALGADGSLGAVGALGAIGADGADVVVSSAKTGYVLGTNKSIAKNIAAINLLVLIFII